MMYSAYARFCRLIGYEVLETPDGVWIGPSHGFFNRMPLYETGVPSEEELQTLFGLHHMLGVHFAAKPGSRGKASHNYFIRDRHYGLEALDKKGRWSVQKGLKNCRVRPMDFDEVHRLGMPLNRDSLSRQGRADPMFTDKDQWARLCRAAKAVEQVQAWGAFVGDALGAYLISIRLGKVVSLLYSNTSTDLLNVHPSPALFFTVIQTLMQTPGVEAIYNGPEWLASGEGLDRFKRRLGFVAEPIVFVLQLRPLAGRVLLNREVRRTISSLGPLLLEEEFHRRVEDVLEMADLSSKTREGSRLSENDRGAGMKDRKSDREKLAAASPEASEAPSLRPGDLVRVRPRAAIEKTLDRNGQLRGCLFAEEMWQLCGTVQRVFKPMLKYLDEQDYKIRQCRGVVLLENVICQGSAYPEGCDCACFFFWREEWLEKIPQS